MTNILGERCQKDIDECLSNPCLNGGTCIDEINGFTCNCTEQWMGQTCERPYDVCDLKPCSNNGTCIPGDYRDKFTCSCMKGMYISYRNKYMYFLKLFSKLISLTCIFTLRF